MTVADFEVYLVAAPRFRCDGDTPGCLDGGNVSYIKNTSGVDSTLGTARRDLLPC